MVWGWNRAKGTNSLTRARQFPLMATHAYASATLVRCIANSVFTLTCDARVRVASRFSFPSPFFYPFSFFLLLSYFLLLHFFNLSPLLSFILFSLLHLHTFTLCILIFCMFSFSFLNLILFLRCWMFLFNYCIFSCIILVLSDLFYTVGWYYYSNQCQSFMIFVFLCIDINLHCLSWPTISSPLLQFLHYWYAICFYCSLTYML